MTIYGNMKVENRFNSTKLKGTGSGNLVSVITNTQTCVQYLSIGECGWETSVEQG